MDAENAPTVSLLVMTLRTDKRRVLDAIGKLISATSSEKWIEMYEQSRLMTKAGQARMAKQGV